MEPSFDSQSQFHVVDIDNDKRDTTRTGGQNNVDEAEKNFSRKRDAPLVCFTYRVHFKASFPPKYI